MPPRHSALTLAALFASTALSLLGPAPSHGQALLFDADADEAAFTLDNEPDLSGELTVEAWVRMDASADPIGFNFIVSKNLSGTGYALLTSGTGTNKRFRFEANLVTGTAVASSLAPVYGRWTHVAGTWSPGQLRLYVDGVLQVQANVADPPVSNSQPVQIGSSPFGTDFNWRGDIDEVRLWSRALSASEIRRAMWQSIEHRAARTLPGLEASWTLSDGAGTAAIDQTGNGHHLSLTGTVWTAGPSLLAPGLENVVTGVSELVSPGSPGSVLSYGANWQALAGGDDDASILSAFAMASCYGSGRAAILGHDGLPANVFELDNADFMVQLMTWLAGSGAAQIGYTSGHGEFLNGAISGLSGELTAAGHTVSALPAPLSAGALASYDALIVGNAWGAFSAAEIDAVDDWTAAGGGILMVGLGWSWPGEIPDYPMAMLGERFGATWTRSFASDPTNSVNGSPVFSRFFPTVPAQDLARSQQTLLDSFAQYSVQLPDELETNHTLRNEFTRAHAVLAQASGVFRADSFQLADLAQLHAEIAATSGSAALDKAVPYGLANETFAWLRERFFKTWIESIPPTRGNPRASLQDITTLGNFPDFYSRQLLDHGVYVMDNTAADSNQQRELTALFDLVPAHLHDLAFLSMRSSIGIGLPENMNDSEYFAGDRSSVNTFSTPVGQVQENPFPGDVPPWIMDAFVAAAAHELNHIVDAFFVQGTPELASRRATLLAAAGSDSLNYLRSMLPPGFFAAAPQEFVASIANQWLANSERVFELGAARFDAGRPQPLNQALFFAEIYASGSGGLPFYQSNAGGNLARLTVPVSRDAAGHIRTLETPLATWTFLREAATGDVLSYQRGPSSWIFADGFESGATSSWSAAVP